MTTTTTTKTITPGAILVSSWGYEQTNIDYFRVDKVQNGWATITPLKQVIVERTDVLAERVAPSDETKGAPMRRKIRAYSDTEEYVKIKSYNSAYVWSGNPQLQTHYH